MTSDEIDQLQEDMNKLSDAEYVSQATRILEVNTLYIGLGSTGVAREEKPHISHLLDTLITCGVVRDTVLTRMTDSDKNYETSLQLTSLYFDIVKLIRALRKVISYNSLVQELGYDMMYASAYDISNKSQFSVAVIEGE